MTEKKIDKKDEALDPTQRRKIKDLSEIHPTIEEKEEAEARGEIARSDAQKIAEKLGGDKTSAESLDIRILNQVHKLLKSTDSPTRLKNKYVKRFVKCLADGKFSEKGKFAFRFLDALENGGPVEKAEAQKMITKISQGEKISATAEKRLRKKLTSLRHEDQETQVPLSVSSLANTIMGQAGTQNRVEKSTKIDSGNWEIASPPAELIRELDNADIKMANLAEKANSIRDELDEKESLLEEKRSQKTGTNPELAEEIRKLEAEIDKLQREVAATDREIDDIAVATKEQRKQWEVYFERTRAQFRALKAISKRAGLNMNAVNKINTWFLKLDPRKATPLDGIVFDEITGKAKKLKKLISIDRIFFSSEKADTYADSPGELRIEYTEDDNGKSIKKSSNLVNFITLIDALDGYPEYDSIDEFNEEYTEELGYADIQNLEGTVFIADEISDMDGDELGLQKKQFTVKEVSNATGKWKIKIEPPMVTCPKQRLSKSVPGHLYADKIKGTFELGEFGAFLRKDGFQRELNKEEMQEVVDRSIAARNKECEGYIHNSPENIQAKYKAMGVAPAGKLRIPEKGQERKVRFKNSRGHYREGVLRTGTDIEGKPSYEVEWDEKENQKEHGSRQWGMPTMPGVRAALDNQGLLEPQPVDMTDITPEFAERARKPLIKKQKYDGASLAQALNKGEIEEMEEGNRYDDEDVDYGQPSEQNPVPYEQPAQESEDQKPQPGGVKVKVHDEALPYDKVFKAGDMGRKEGSIVATWWANTRFLSNDDIWEMAKAMYDYYIRRFERKQKEKYSFIGQELPYWAPEMQRVNQAAENEFVNQFKESFDQKGVYEIQERCRKTNNRDELKAAMSALSEKGQIRWDDIAMWNNINKFVDASVAIPIPKNGDPNTQMSETDPRTGFDFLKGAIDSLWGEGQYNDWFNQSKSQYLSNAQSYFEEGKQLEGVQGGHARRLGVLLKQHKNGEFVDPHEYEGLIQHSIQAGKSSMQAKIYYMIEGIAAQNADGRTILSFDRMAHINSELLGNFPILEYLCAPVSRPDSDGKPSYRFTMDDYKQWARWFDNGDVSNPDNCVPTAAVDRFMWKYVIPSDETQNRINKALRHGENLDHDDMFAYLPPASEQIVTDSCKSTTGSKKFLTIEGYANVFPGFSQYIRSCAENGNKEKLLEAVKSYVRYEGIMMNRFEKERDVYQRMDDYTLNTSTIVSITPPKAYIDQLNSAIGNVIAAYDDSELTEVFETLKKETGDISIKTEREEQNRINYAFQRFGKVFSNTIKKDKGNKMVAILAGSNLEGMPQGVSDEEKDRRKAQYSNPLALD